MAALSRVEESVARSLPGLRNRPSKVTTANYFQSMIDTRDQVLTSSSTTTRRSPALARGKRVSKKRGHTSKPSVRIERIFSDPRTSPFDQVEWEKRTAEITDDAGKVIFKQENVEVPKSWSLLATKVVVSKYFYGEQNTSERETSVRQLIHRICRTIADWGVKDGYFSKADGEVFYDELTWLCLNQYGAFNSPVWFNVGLYHQYGVGNNSAQGQLVLQSQDRRGRARQHAIRISAVQRLLHPVGRGQHGRHHAPGPQRGDALQVRLRHRHRPVADPFQQGKAQRRRPAQRPDVLPEGL